MPFKMVAIRKSLTGFHNKIRSKPRSSSDEKHIVQESSFVNRVKHSVSIGSTFSMCVEYPTERHPTERQYRRRRRFTVAGILDEQISTFKLFNDSTETTIDRQGVKTTSFCNTNL